MNTYNQIVQIRRLICVFSRHYKDVCFVTHFIAIVSDMTRHDYEQPYKGCVLQTHKSCDYKNNLVLNRLLMKDMRLKHNKYCPTMSIS